MKRARTAGISVLVLALAVMAVNKLVLPLPDWAVRTAGVVMLLALAVTAYSIVKGNLKR